MSTDANDQPTGQEQDDAAKGRRILIGSQRDPDAYRPKRPRDWAPPPGSEPAVAPAPPAEPPPAAAEPAPVAEAPHLPPAPEPVAPPPPAPVAVAPVERALPSAPEPMAPSPARQAGPTTPAQEPGRGFGRRHRGEGGGEGEPEEGQREGGHRGRGPRNRRPPKEKPSVLDSIPKVEKTVPVPSKRGDPLADGDFAIPELEDGLGDAIGELSMDDLLSVEDGFTRQAILERESRHVGRVVAVRRDVVFVELGGREQGVLPLVQLPEVPQPGQQIEVVVARFNSEEGLYELIAPHGAMSIGDWEDLNEGMVVDARVTGQNTGGLEVEVNRLRGFIPISQVALYRVENFDEFVGQKFPCVVTEVNVDRRRLVLSRRAFLEREKEEAREQLWTSLAEGQVHDGVVRKIMDFGAFVDIGGVDGLLHISQLSWARVKHPSEVLHEGQAIKVRVSRIDQETRKISLSYRDMLENPWTTAASKYPPNAVARGVVTKIMEFGAFVQLEPGIEGLVHVSELSPKRVWRVAEVVQEGQEVEVLVLSVDSESERISLSMKALAAKPEPEKKEEEASIAAPPPPAARKKPSAPLKGGLGDATGGEAFGLKW
jgi:predicted RNA-binding protein with RPS1 domain